VRAKLHFDGSLESYGYVIESAIVTGDTRRVPSDLKQTNNVAEYLGLIAGLETAINLGISDIEIIGDSKLVIYQVEGRYKCRAKHLKPLLHKAKRLLSLMPSYNLRWVPRAENRADNYSRVCLQNFITN